MVDQSSVKPIPISLNAVISLILSVFIASTAVITLFTPFGSEGSLNFLLFCGPGVVLVSILLAIAALLQRLFVARKLWWLAFISILMALAGLLLSFAWIGSAACNAA